jgi:3-oxoacyl-[acyl-carrier protein] reductase
MQLGLAGKRALVTAASRGLGRASALSLGREGARVAVASRNLPALEGLAREITSAGDAVAFPLHMNIADAASVASGVAAVADRWGGVDILVANGPGPASGPFDSIDLETWRTALNETVLSMVNLAQAVIPVMRAGGGGRIVFITTVGVKVTQPGMVLSNATRLAIVGIAKTLSIELAPDNILVNALCPGPIATDRMKELIADTKARGNLSDEEAEAVWLDEVPLGRMGRPEEFGDIVAVLCSDVASFVTGAAIAVDGGKSRTY